jgi:hypothetical protein
MKHTNIYVSLGRHCKNSVMINLQKNTTLYQNVSVPLTSVNQQFDCALQNQVIEILYSFVLNVYLNITEYSLKQGGHSHLEILAVSC